MDCGAQLAGDLLAMTRQFKQQQLELRSQAQDDQQVGARRNRVAATVSRCRFPCGSLRALLNRRSRVPLTPARFGQVLSRTDELISSNGEQIRTRVSALQKLEGAVGGWQTCKTICLLLVCVGIFTVTFVFMRVVGKRG